MTIDLNVFMQVLQILVIVSGIVGFMWRVKASIASVEQRLTYIDNRIEQLGKTTEEKANELNKAILLQARHDERFSDIDDKLKTLFLKLDNLSRRRRGNGA